MFDLVTVNCNAKVCNISEAGNDSMKPDVVADSSGVGRAGKCVGTLEKESC